MNNGVVKPLGGRDPLIGQTLQDRYRVLRRIGRGGMGVVYLAEHVLLRKRVALKTLAAEATGSPELAARFLREAQAAAAVGNDHIVDVTDMGELDSGLLYFVLEYLDGVDLGWKVRAEGPLEVQAALEVLLQLCEALAAVHAAGIIHRDLKPENLFLVRRNNRDFLKVLDFGICKIRQPWPSTAGLTASGTTLGTPNFMAPEQVEGAASVDHRADVYAAGAIAYFLLVGEPPFAASSLPRLFIRICTDDPVAPRDLRPEIPEILEEVIMRALSKNPDDRYRDCADLQRALLQALAYTPTQRLSHRTSGDRLRGRIAVPEHDTVPPAPRAPSGADVETAAALETFVRRITRRRRWRVVGVFAVLLSVLVLAIALLRPATRRSDTALNSAVDGPPAAVPAVDGPPAVGGLVAPSVDGPARWNRPSIPTTDRPTEQRRPDRVPPPAAAKRILPLSRDLLPRAPTPTKQGFPGVAGQRASSATGAAVAVPTGSVKSDRAERDAPAPVPGEPSTAPQPVDVGVSGDGPAPGVVPEAVNTEVVQTPYRPSARELRKVF